MYEIKVQPSNNARIAREDVKIQNACKWEERSQTSFACLGTTEPGTASASARIVKIFLHSDLLLPEIKMVYTTDNSDVAGPRSLGYNTFVSFFLFHWSLAAVILGDY